MGAWGTGLYSDDTTCEVRDEFKSHLEAGMSHAMAEKAILESFSDVLSDHQVECLVFFALADTLWRHGCLSGSVKQHTLDLLNKGGDIQYWEKDAPTESKKRAKILAALRSRLLSSHPPLKQVKLKPYRPPKKQLSSPVGTVFGLLLPNGNMAALKFVGLRTTGNSEDAVFRLLPWKGKELTSTTTLEDISNKAVVICNHDEFALFTNDRRQNPTSRLVHTEIHLNSSLPLDHSRHVSVSITSLPKIAQEALDNL